MAAPASRALRMLLEHNLAPRQLSDFCSAKMGTWRRASSNFPACFAVGPRGPASSDGEPLVLDAAKSAVEVDVVTGSRALEGRGVERWKRGAV